MLTNQQIRQNIAALQSQGAQTQDIEAYLSSLGAAPIQPPEPTKPNIFNWGAAKDVFTRAGEDVQMAVEEDGLGVGTAIIQGGLAPFRALGEGFGQSYQGEHIIGSAIEGLTKFGEMITPESVQDWVGDKALETIAGYEYMDPIQQLKMRNRLGVAEGLSYFLGGKAAQGATGATSSFVKGTGRAAIKKVAGPVVRGAEKLIPDKSPVNRFINRLDKSFIGDNISVNNKMDALVEKWSRPDAPQTHRSLLREVAEAGLFPTIKGKLARWDGPMEEIFNAQGRITTQIDGLLDPVTDLTDISALKAQALANLAKSPVVDVDLDTLVSRLNREFKSLENKSNSAPGWTPGKLTAKQVNQTRVNMNAKTRKYSKTDQYIEDVANAIADATRDRLDDIAPAVRGLNQEWADWARKGATVKVLHNRPVDIGILGSQVGKLAGVLLAAEVGLALAGPGSLVVAGVMAYYGGEWFAALLRRKFFSPKVKETLLKSLRENPNLARQMIEDTTGADKTLLIKEILDTDDPINFHQKLLPAPAIRMGPRGSTQPDPTGLSLRDAQAGPVGFDPKTGKFKKTYTSFSEGEIPQTKGVIGKAKEKFGELKDAAKENMAKRGQAGFARLPGRRGETQITDNLKRKISPENIVSTEPILNTKRELVVKDLQGNKHTLPANDAIQATKLKNGNVHIIDGDEFVVNKNQYENIRNQSLTEEPANPFAPELEDTKEVYVGKGPAKRPAEETSGQDFQNWSESKDNPRAKNYSMIIVQAQDVMAKTDAYISRMKSKYGKDWDQKRSESERAEGLSSAKDKTRAFTGGHVKADNQLFHIRGFEDTYKGAKTWFGDEWQSDWMLALRKEGQRLAEKELGRDAPDIEINKLGNNYLKYHMEGKEIPPLKELPKGWEVKKDGKDWVVYKANGDLAEGLKVVEGTGTPIGFNTKEKAIKSALKKLNEDRKFDTPWNPELKTWVPSAIKRHLLEAVDRDAEWFAWTNGRQQQKRYSQISQEVESISWEPMFASSEAKETSRLVKIDLANKSETLELLVDNSGIITKVIPESQEKMFIGKNIDEALSRKEVKKVMTSEKGEILGEDIRMGATWAESLYERQGRKLVEDLTGGKTEEINMGYTLKEREGGGRLTDEQLDDLMERGIDPDLDTTASEGDLVQYFGEDHYVLSDDGNGYTLIREADVQNKWDWYEYRSGEYDFEWENIKEDITQPFMKEQMDDLVTKDANPEGGLLYEFKTWNGESKDFYLVKDGHWGSDKNSGGRYINSEEPPPKLISADDATSVDNYENFTFEDLEKYLKGKLEGDTPQQDLFGKDRTKAKEIEDWIEANQFDADDKFMYERLDEQSIDVEKLIEERLDERGLTSAQGAADDWMETRGEDAIAVGDEMWTLDSDSQIYAPYDEDAIASLRAENAEMMQGNVEDGLMQPAIRLTPEIKARIRGEKVPLKLPSGNKGEMLPALLPFALYIYLNE